MSINPQHLLNEVIEPVLKYLNLYSEEAAMLILGTGIQESRLRYLVQLNNGPAKGIYQMEPATHRDIWDSYLAFRADLASKVRGLASQLYFFEGGDRELIGNLQYATAMTRIHYLRKKPAIPKDLNGWAEYWKRHYNTPLGNGTEQEFITNFQDMMT